MRSIHVLLLLAAGAPLAGCGGGGPDNFSSPSARASFTVVWPRTSRLIPEASNSIRVEMLRNNVSFASQLLSRPAGGGSATVLFDKLPIDTLVARARAYPQADGTGVAQASGSTPLTTQPGQTVNFTITMASTVASIALTAPPLAVGQQGQMVETATDASAAIVLLTPSKQQWSSSDTSVVTVDNTGRVTAVATGAATITALDTESGKSGSVLVGVAPANAVQNPANGHYYAAVDTTTLISWHNAKTAAAAMRINGLAGHLVTITSAAENSFVAAHFAGDSVKSYWTGGYQDHSAADYSEPAGGWRWVTGEPWSYTNWHAGEPNDTAGLSDYLNLYPDSTWNDAIDNDGHGFGYIVEFEP